MSRALLNGYIRSVHSARFEYGRHDCALFAAGWVKLKTGRDLTCGASYRSLRGGIEILQSLGFSDHVEATATFLPEVPLLTARLGDIAAIPGRRRIPILGIVTGERIAVLTRPKGGGFIPLTEAVRAFRVE